MTKAFCTAMISTRPDERTYLRLANQIHLVTGNLEVRTPSYSAWRWLTAPYIQSAMTSTPRCTLASDLAMTANLLPCRWNSRTPLSESTIGIAGIGSLLTEIEERLKGGRSNASNTYCCISNQ
jgi:hypothetical protein